MPLDFSGLPNTAVNRRRRRCRILFAAGTFISARMRKPCFCYHAVARHARNSHPMNETARRINAGLRWHHPWVVGSRERHTAFSLSNIAGFSA
jgi:hypothetical protein